MNNLKDHYTLEEQNYILDLVMDKHKISEQLDDLLPSSTEATLSLLQSMQLKNSDCFELMKC
ncbi:MAG: hypothetical protein IPG53_11200 [Ignavibacteriales bacterium]|nr:hypothetical protein [Ignavibacteriales bacterium]